MPERPPFTREAVYATWADAHSAQWMLDDDQMESSIKLLLRAKNDKSSPFEFDKLPIIAPEGYEVFSFALPDVLGQWGGRIREVAMDSTCESASSV